MYCCAAEGWATLFNTPLLSTEPIPDKPGWVWDVFETTPTMSTYLIAIAIQDFSSQAAQGGSNMTIWATEEYIQVGANYRRCQMVVFTPSPRASRLATLTTRRRLGRSAWRGWRSSTRCPTPSPRWT